MRLIERIKIVPGNIFLCVELPDRAKENLQTIADGFGDDVSAVVDHVTLVFIPKGESPIPHDKINAALEAAEAVSARHPPIEARLTGWAYFDGASKDGEEKTALVALVDAPGLAELHVDLVAELKALGIDTNNGHGFNPHVTFAYLEKGGRVDDLPVIDERFVIDEITTASDDIVKLPLTGTVGESLVRELTRAVLDEKNVRRARKREQAPFKTSKSRKDWWVQAKSSGKINSYLKSLGMLK